MSKEKRLKKPNHICDGHYDLNYKCSICGKHIGEDFNYAYFYRV